MNYDFFYNKKIIALKTKNEITYKEYLFFFIKNKNNYYIFFFIYAYQKITPIKKEIMKLLIHSTNILKWLII